MIEKVFCQASVGASDSRAQIAKHGPITRAARGEEGRDYKTEQRPRRKESACVGTEQRICLIIDRKQEGGMISLATGGMSIFIFDFQRKSAEEI